MLKKITEVSQKNIFSIIKDANYGHENYYLYLIYDEYLKNSEGIVVFDYHNDFGFSLSKLLSKQNYLNYYESSIHQCQNLISQLENNLNRKKRVLKNNFKRVSYTEAIDILRNSKPNKKKKFNYIIEEWGADLQSEHERYLVEKHFGCPVVIYDYPADIKAFYMRLNDDGKTVRAMDVLFPGIGEIAGGSQREERYDVLLSKMREIGIDEKELWWYLDTRKFGTCVHSGFGLGFERLVLFATGMSNIRDVIPYPRSPQNAEF
jgi:aspartyl/asparaginyl-tRNA synthetase